MEVRENLYFKARREAAESNEGLSSREKTAELLGVSVSTLANYELSVTKMVPPDAVVMMADLYNAPELKLHYCANDCPIGRGLPIPTRSDGIERTVVKVLNSLIKDRVEMATQKLLQVALDGKLIKDDQECTRWLLDYIEELSANLGELKLVCNKLLADNGLNERKP